MKHYVGIKHQNRLLKDNSYELDPLIKTDKAIIQNKISLFDKGPKINR